MRLRYKMVVYRYDPEFGLDHNVFRTEGSNNLSYFDKFKNKENFRIIIKEGSEIIYSEVDEAIERR